MNHSKCAATMATVAAVLAVAGCGRSGSSGGADGGSGNVPPPPVSPTPPPPTTTNFTVFTRDLLVSAATSETSDPAELESIEWAFTDDDNETTYDDVIAASGP